MIILSHEIGHYIGNDIRCRKERAQLQEKIYQITHGVEAYLNESRDKEENFRKCVLGGEKS